jgi:uncharacterized protein YuzE
MDERMNFFYDHEGDILDISIGEPKEAISEEIGDDILIRRDIHTNEVVGFTILNFEKRFQSTPKKQSVPVKVKFAVQENVET